MKRVILFAPAALCAAICFQALVMAARAKISWSQTLFYAFLPVCFLLMVATLVRLGHEISRLRRRLAKLEAKLLPDSRFNASRTPAETSSSEVDADSLASPHHSSAGRDRGL